MLLKKIFDKQYSFLRRLRLVYIIHTIFNYSLLKKNKALYVKYGLKKVVWWPISGKDFKDKKAASPWLDRLDAVEVLKQNTLFKNFNTTIQQELLNWPEQGFVILKQFFSIHDLDTINNEIERLLLSKDVYLNYSGKQIISAHEKSETIKQIIHNKNLNRILEFILDKKLNIFQSINFIKGSEIKPHSDFFHMATFPEGNTIAVWLALEDVDETNGPLLYYPGSHKIPYVYCHDFAHENNFLHIDAALYAKYENKIAELIKIYHLYPKKFYAKKGDVLIWHANLLHGGAKILDKEKTRKSMVMHYFAKDVICYHEITQRPAIQKNN